MIWLFQMSDEQRSDAAEAPATIRLASRWRDKEADQIKDEASKHAKSDNCCGIAFRDCSLWGGCIYNQRNESTVII